MFSIITPTYNRAPVLERTLNHVFAMDCSDRCEVIVVNDGSTDNTEQVLDRFSQQHPNLYAVNQENSGPGVARDTGLGLATRKRILFIDDDVFPQPDLLHAHKRFLDRGFHLSQGVLEWTEELASDWVIRFMDTYGMQFGFHKVEDPDHLSYLYVYTANLAVEHKAIRAVGGFNAAFAAKRYAFEDTAFAYMLHKNGCLMGLNREAKALHHHPITPEQLVGREYKVGYALGTVMEQYPEIFASLGFAPVSSAQSVMVNVIKGLLATPMVGLCSREMRLRLACKEAFERGRQDYVQDNR